MRFSRLCNLFAWLYIKTTYFFYLIILFHFIICLLDLTKNDKFQRNDHVFITSCLHWGLSDETTFWYRCCNTVCICFVLPDGTANGVPLAFSLQGQCFMVIDPSSFAPGFPERMSSLMGECRGLQPVSIPHCGQNKMANILQTTYSN